MSAFLIDYPFANQLYPNSLDVLERFRAWGPTVIFSDGDAVFQPRKIERSGLREAVDDKLRILTAGKRLWGARVTTVFPRQGHYARDPKALATSPPADVSIARIGQLLDHDLAALRAGGTPEGRCTMAPRKGNRTRRGPG